MNTATPAVTPVENLSFEDALGELETIVKTLETGQAKLEDSIGKYERGIALKNHCEQKLREAQAKIEKSRSAKTEAYPPLPSTRHNERRHHAHQSDIRVEKTYFITIICVYPR